MRLPLSMMLLICLMSLTSSFCNESWLQATPLAATNPRFKRSPREQPRGTHPPHSQTTTSESSQTLRSIPAQPPVRANPRFPTSPRQSRTRPRIYSKSPSNSTVPRAPRWMTSGKFQGDIAGFRDQADFDHFVERVNGYYDRMRSRGRDGHVGSVMKDPRRLWPAGLIPYVIQSQEEELRHVIKEAIGDFHEHTCLRFVERTHEEHYVRITADKVGCWSALGMNDTSRPQDLNLAYECWTKGEATHELMHTIGFWHEHQRIDRDEFVLVHEDIIECNCFRRDYRKANYSVMNLIGPYDIHSVMHYPMTGYCSENGQLSMTPRDSTVTTMGNGDGMTAQDIWKVNKLYKCPAPTPVATTTSTAATRRWELPETDEVGEGGEWGRPPLTPVATSTGPAVTTSIGPDNCPHETSMYSTDSDGNQFPICAIVYEQEECNGRKLVIEKGKTALDLSDVSMRGGGTWNDKIASMELNPNCKITFSMNTNFLGRNQTYYGGSDGSNFPDVQDWLRGQISSLDCVCGY